MRAIIQRVSEASVKVGEEEVGKIGLGFMILLAIHVDDTPSDAEKIASKISALRLFADNEKPINASLSDVDGDILLISQFTLYADTTKGNRPSFGQSAGAEKGKMLFDLTHHLLESKTRKSIPTGIFGAHMQVALINNGPVTIILDSRIS